MYMALNVNSFWTLFRGANHKVCLWSESVSFFRFVESAYSVGRTAKLSRESNQNAKVVHTMR